MMYMVRKQLYLTERQDAELKRKAVEAGVSEAEVVRRALDLAFVVGPSTRLRPGRREAIEALARTWADPDSALVGAFDREALYQERLDRLANRDREQT